MKNRHIAQNASFRRKKSAQLCKRLVTTIDFRFAHYGRGYASTRRMRWLDLLAPLGGNLIGQPIAAYLPELHHALRPEGPQFRASMQCRGHRGTGEPFLAEVWFSSFKEKATPKVAAIIADRNEEQTEFTVPDEFDQKNRPLLSSRELEVLRLVVQGLANKEIASKMQLSESVIKNSLQQLFSKTQVRTRSQLVRVAFERFRDQL